MPKDFINSIGGEARSSYRKLVINNDGTGIISRWENGTETGRHIISLTLSGQGFTVAIEPNVQYGDTVQEVVGTAYFKVSGSSKIIALATADTDSSVSPAVQTKGMLIGSTDSTVFPAGGYADNNYDDGQAYTDAWTGGLTVTATALQVNGKTLTYQNNTPQTGFIGVPVDAGQPVDTLISSALGFFAATTQYDAAVGPKNTAGGASITFAIRPQQ